MIVRESAGSGFNTPGRYQRPRHMFVQFERSGLRYEVGPSGSKHGGFKVCRRNVVVRTVYLWSGWFTRFTTQLESGWQRNGAPIAEHLAPGASAEHLAQLENRSLLELPPELTAWWSWHDGVTNQDFDDSGNQIGPLWHFLSSDQAFAEHQQRWNLFGSPYLPPDLAVEAAAEVDPDDDDAGWVYTWLPIFRYQAHILFVDCQSVSLRGTVPVRQWAHTPEDIFTPATGSLTGLIGSFAYMIDSGIFTWSSEEQRWLGPEDGGPDFFRMQQIL